MLKTIIIIVAVVIVGVLIFAATKPDTFRVQRAASIKAPPEKIFPLIDDLRSMQTWSDLGKSRPGDEKNLSRRGYGKGAVYEWAGNKEIGEGHMEIIGSAPPSAITIKMDFIKPCSPEHRGVHVAADGDSTRVTQAIFGPSPYISKLMGLVFDMDKTIGGKFEQGLAELKALAERSQGGFKCAPRRWACDTHSEKLGSSFALLRRQIIRLRFNHDSRTFYSPHPIRRNLCVT